ncbi:mediator of RNA polymerase II transcription subunit 15-like [Mizuhopecten yessoensis]|uniref:Uncharacterized protein n=1 Tax=Mizuhopecten yessoensis TaxID=6573 RepID=A0A210PPB2_MIZYE|nr:mediator of RNA polymerase II transcription subunit 15-like [Mizuhopecten yessoensis]XP_021378573.1 mediator of RNA polymerase II transcription subunit 15-like [Mizuhopecten yessoensis]OWF38313.1 hypothetical protein KP79_PYT17238 [Mizuhopecten yessoensis]
MQVLVLLVAVMVQLAAGQDDPFAMFNTNTNSMSSGTQTSFGQLPPPETSSTNTFGQAPPANTPNQFGQPQPTGQQPPTATQFGQQNQFGQQVPAQPAGQPTNQFPTNGNNPPMSFQQPQQGAFGQQQNTFGNQPNNNMNQIGGQPGNMNSLGNSGMNQGNSQQQLTPDQAFLVGGQWNQQQPQQNNGRTMFSSFDPNNPAPFQPQGQQTSFGNGQFGGTQQFGGPQNPNQNFMNLGTSGNDLNTFRDNNLPVGEVDNIRFGIGPNQQPFRMDAGTMNFGQNQQQRPAAPANNFSPFSPFTTGGVDPAGFGGMQGGGMGGMPGAGMGGMPGAGMGGMPMGVMPGGFGGGFGGPGPQGFGSFLPPPPPQPSGGIFSRLFGRGAGSGGGFFTSLFGKKK